MFPTSPHLLRHWPTTVLLLALLLIVGCNEKGKPGLTGKPHGSATATPAADPVDAAVSEQGSRQAVERILTVVKLDNPSELAPYMAYKGADKSIHFTRAYDYTSEVEKVDVDKTYAQLQVLLLGMQEMDYVAFSQERESEATWNVWQLALFYEDGSKEQVSMALVEVDGEYLLADLR